MKFLTHLSLIILIAAAATGCSDVPVVDLGSGWKHTVTDSPEFASVDFDDSGWRTVDLPASLYTEKKAQAVWIRRSVELPDSMVAMRPWVFLGKIWDADSTYFNGVQIGETGREKPYIVPTWNVDRSYLIPPELIRRGEKNVIAVRVFGQLNPIMACPIVHLLEADEVAVYLAINRASLAVPRSRVASAIRHEP